MIWRILATGEPKLSYARQGFDEYKKRLLHFAKIETVFFKTARTADYLNKSIDCRRILLDPRGEQITSEELAQKISNWEMQGHRPIALMIGGADGHDDELRKQTDWNWSLGKLTLQHELALLVVMEQIYRAYSILRGLPYHRK